MSEKAATLKAKKAYFASVRRSNYLASLRLEGFSVQEDEASRDLPSRAAIINAYRRVKS